MLIEQSKADIMGGFVVIEGIDGCGKSSVARLLVKRLGSRAVLTREPTESWIGQAVRRGDRHKISPYIDALLFMADRAQHTEQVAEWLARRKTVVCDRYYHSTVAYQTACLEGIFEGDAFKWLLEANLRISIHPDLTVFLTIPPELGLQRIRTRSELSRFERLSFLRKVQKNYIRLAELDKTIVKVDGAKDLQSVTNEVLSLVKERKI